MSKKLTIKQETVLELIKKSFNESHKAPTLNELKSILGLKTKRGVVKHLEALDSKGYIYHFGGERGMKLTDPNFIDTIQVPILGYANAGKPLVIAEEDFHGYIQIDQSLLKINNVDVFSLIIKGDSMNMRTINKVPMLNGNFIIVEKSNDIKNGDVVLAVIDGNATVKTLKKTDQSIILYPESDNPAHSPLYINNENQGFINGKIIAVLENPNI